MATSSQMWYCANCSELNRPDVDCCKNCNLRIEDDKSSKSVVSEGILKFSEHPEGEILTTSASKMRIASHKGVSSIPKPQRDGIDILELRMVLIGLTGMGKSETGNTILGTTAFSSEKSFMSVTKKCQHFARECFNRKLLVVDTPGIFDTSGNLEEINTEIKKCIGLSAPGPHAFLLVVSLTQRFTKQDYLVLGEMEEMFGKNVSRHMIVCFTGRDELGSVKPADYITKSPESLNEILKLTDERYVTFNNKGSNEEKEEDTKKLLSVIDDMLLKNSGCFYTSEKYEFTEQIIQESIWKELSQGEAEMRREIKRKVKAGIEKEREISRRRFELKETEGLENAGRAEKTHSDTITSTNQKCLRKLIHQEEEIRGKRKTMKSQLKDASGDDEKKIQHQRGELKRELNEMLSQIRDAKKKVTDEMFEEAAIEKCQSIREKERENIKNEVGIFASLKAGILNLFSIANALFTSLKAT